MANPFLEADGMLSLPSSITAVFLSRSLLNLRQLDEELAGVGSDSDNTKRLSFWAPELSADTRMRAEAMRGDEDIGPDSDGFVMLEHRADAEAGDG